MSLRNEGHSAGWTKPVDTTGNPVKPGGLPLKDDGLESALRRLDEFYEGDAYPKPEQQRSAMVKQLDVDPAKVDDIVKQLRGSA